MSQNTGLKKQKTSISFQNLFHLTCGIDITLSRHCSIAPVILAVLPPSTSKVHSALHPTAWGPHVSDHWETTLRKRHSTATELTWWRSVMIVLIQHAKDITYYVPYWQQNLQSQRARLREHPFQTADHHCVLPSTALSGLWCWRFCSHAE